jgi:hypothetical protein
LAQLSEAGLLCLGDHAPFDEALKIRQTQVVAAVKEVKAARKAAVVQEAEKLDKFIATAESTKKKLLSNLKALVKAGDTSVFDQMEAIALGIDQIEEDDDEAEVLSRGADEEWGQTASIPIAGAGDRVDRVAAAEVEATATGKEPAADLEAAMAVMRTAVPLKGMSVPAAGNPLDQLRFFDWSSRLLKAQHAALNLDYYFPKAEGWKLRVFIPEENMYMGAKDIGVERLKCNMAMSLGKDGLQVTLSDIEFLCTVSRTRVAGRLPWASYLNPPVNPLL